MSNIESLTSQTGDLPVFELQLHYVGALTPYHHKNLINDAMDNFQELEVNGSMIQVYRDKRVV